MQNKVSFELEYVRVSINRIEMKGEIVRSDNMEFFERRLDVKHSCTICIGSILKYQNLGHRP